MIAIKFENISKQYRLGLVSTRTLGHDLNRWWQTNIRGKEDPYLTIGSVNDHSTKADSDYVWALRDINFEVEQGDVVGIIGKNGAGKSTLLKILSKVTTPTTGTIKAKGRIASLLEIGTGFHPEMTGRENIYMNGAIMGMTRAEIARKFDEIVDFAGVERYIDTPVKRYSSGMTVRLGFAVAAFLEPEILVVDEVLAVGDAEFQKKAIGKMQNISHGDGRTVLFVSHNMDSIRMLCNKAILMENGSITKKGYTEEICDFYMSEYNTNLQDLFIASPDKSIGDNFVELLEMRIIDKNKNPLKSIFVTSEFGVLVKYRIIDDLYKPDLTFLISTNRNENIFHSVHETKDYSTGKKIYIAWFPANLFNDKNYIFTLGITTSNPLLIHLQKSISFSVSEDFNSVTRQNNYKGEFHGVLRPYINWEKL